MCHIMYVICDNDTCCTWLYVYYIYICICTCPLYMTCSIPHAQRCPLRWLLRAALVRPLTAFRHRTPQIMKKKAKKGKAAGKTLTKSEPCESFFNFFSPPKVGALEGVGGPGHAIL